MSIPKNTTRAPHSLFSMGGWAKVRLHPPPPADLPMVLNDVLMNPNLNLNCRQAHGGAYSPSSGGEKYPITDGPVSFRDDTEIPFRIMDEEVIGIERKGDFC